MSSPIRRRGKGTWEVTVELGADPETGKRRRLTRNVKGTRRDAERYQASILHSLDTGSYIEPNKITVGELLTRWLDDHARTRVRPSTYQSYANQVRRHLIPGLGAIKLAQLAPLHIERHYAKELEAGLSARSVTYQHRLLREALQQAMRWQMVGRNVADSVTPPRSVHREMQALDAEQVGLLLQTVTDRADYALIHTAIYTGLRRSELLGLRWQDVDLKAGTASISQTVQRLTGQGFVYGQPKTAKGRRLVALPKSSIEVLGRHRAEQLEERLRLGPAWLERGLVFTNPTGGPVDPPALSRRFAKLLTSASLPHVRFHDLRHTHASLMLQRGVHPKIVSERLGHATVGITLDTYSHVLPGLQAEAARQLDEWLGSSIGRQQTGTEAP